MFDLISGIIRCGWDDAWIWNSNLARVFLVKSTYANFRDLVGVREDMTGRVG